MCKSLNFSISRIEAIIREIEDLRQSEFPYIHSLYALNRLHLLFTDHLEKLRNFPPDKNPRIVKEYCSRSLTDIHIYHPILGFLLRSTNVRNAFEVFGPLLRLSRRILGAETRLVISSEWDYSPYTYHRITALPEYILIGVPASESTNPLLIPLAGHELGHTLWRLKIVKTNREYKNSIERKILKEITEKKNDYNEHFPEHGIHRAPPENNIFIKQEILRPIEWAFKQAEEQFCDLVGLYLFDRAFLHASAYLLSPKTLYARSPNYPNNLTRAKLLVAACEQFQQENPKLYQPPENFTDQFENSEEPFKEDSDKYLLSLADKAAESMSLELIQKISEMMGSIEVPKLSLVKKNELINSFKLMTPLSNPGSLTNIVNAAWEAYYDSELWSHLPQIKNKTLALYEVVLKNIEVLEIEELNNQ